MFCKLVLALLLVNLIQYSGGFSEYEVLGAKLSFILVYSPHGIHFYRRFKTKKWWCQSFLVGIDTILCGFRDVSGIVEKLKVYKVSDLPKCAKSFWSPNICFNFLDSFLGFVKKCLEKEIICNHGERAVNNLKKLPLIALQLEWYPGSSVKVCNSYSHEDDQILPAWFVNEYRKNINLEIID